MDQSDVHCIAERICLEKGLALIELAGQGAFKSVFHVQRNSHESYALKVIKNNSDAELVRTSREIEALNRCDHPNIAQLYNADNCEEAGVHYSYTIEEYLDGGTLGDLIRSEGGLDAERVRSMGSRLIDVLGHLEPLKLVHRDIKPENIMFRSGSDEPILVDFGIVRDNSAASLTQAFLMMGPGTPYFAAPEQLNNKKRLINWRTDQFGLGVTMCFAYMQRHPFQFPGESIESPEIIMRVQSYGPHNDEIKRNLSDAGLGCINIMTDCWPVNRFQSPVDLLAGWLGGRGA